VARRRPLCVFTYPADAFILLEATGKLVPLPPQRMPTPVPPGPTPADYYRGVASDL
jgi:hypothetical protein